MFEARNGSDSPALVREGGERIDLLLADIILPDTNGKTLVEELLAFRGDMEVLYTSGYTKDLITDRGVLHKGINFISKPCSVSSLSKKIREALGRG